MSHCPAHLLPVLRQLSADYFLSGEQVAQRLGCSRATVHNAIQAALGLEFAVHAVRGRGYRLARPVSWLEPARLTAACAADGVTLRVLDSLTSTNAALMAWAAGEGVAAELQITPQRAPHRAAVVAEWQSQGRGRRGRQWLAGLGGGLTFSFLWRSARPAAQLSGLSLAVGVALVRGLRSFGLPAAQVKWPNDIQVGGAKLAGILIELANDKSASDMLAPSSVVIGIGLNVSDGACLTKRLEQPVTDVSAQRAASSGLIDRNELLLHIVRALDVALARFEVAGFAPFQDEWQACHAHQGRPVNILHSQGEVTQGIALGVNHHGALLLETAAGVTALHAGEVSLRAQIL
jgi:BirA family biotin operon repressor/biotin-[acetyl-CoA-carboxylase] ligase